LAPKKFKGLPSIPSSTFPISVEFNSCKLSRDILYGNRKEEKRFVYVKSHFLTFPFAEMLPHLVFMQEDILLSALAIKTNILT